MILLLKSYPYHFVRTILSNAILSVYHFFVHTILSVPFCPLPFCPVTQQLIELHNASGCMKYTSDIHQHRWTVVAKQLIEVDDPHLRQRAHSRAVWFV